MISVIFLFTQTDLSYRGHGGQALQKLEIGAGSGPGHLEVVCWSKDWDPAISKDSKLHRVVPYCSLLFAKLELWNILIFSEPARKRLVSGRPPTCKATKGGFDIYENGKFRVFCSS